MCVCCLLARGRPNHRMALVAESSVFGIRATQESDYKLRHASKNAVGFLRSLHKGMTHLHGIAAMGWMYGQHGSEAHLLDFHARF